MVKHFSRTVMNISKSGGHLMRIYIFKYHADVLELKICLALTTD